jgi:hypothetical protein
MYLVGQHHIPAALSPEENIGTYLIEGWMGPRSGHGLLKKKKSIIPTGIRTPNIISEGA